MQESGPQDLNRRDHTSDAHPIHFPGVKGLLLAALGVVFGDIGTSPIYAFREALHASSGGDIASRQDVLGVLSMIIWALTTIVTIKYVVFVLYADNKGEGGTLSLMALARTAFPQRAGDDFDDRRNWGSTLFWRCHHNPRHLGALSS